MIIFNSLKKVSNNKILINTNKNRSVDKEDIWENQIVQDMKDAIIGVCLTAQDSVELRLVTFFNVHCISSIQV